MALYFFVTFIYISFSLWGSNQKRDHEQGVENECDCFGGAQYAQEFHWHSAVAGSLGGFSAHTRNIVLDVFIAICQYPAQTMESYQCINDGDH